MSDATTQVSAARALGVVLSVAFVCALLVATAAVSLRPYQKANIEAERLAKLELVLNALANVGQAMTIERLEPRIVVLASGLYDDSVDAASFNAASSGGSEVVIPGDADIAGIKRRAERVQIYLVRDASADVEMIILPIYGRGYQSTLHAWLVLQGDTRSVRALKFYQHGETPGVGARIEDPDWEARWPDMPLYDVDGVLRLGVRTLSSASSGAHANFQVDGISGATRTTQGVDHMLRFWLGDYGFGPYLQRMREEQL